LSWTHPDIQERSTSTQFKQNTIEPGFDRNLLPIFLFINLLKISNTTKPTPTKSSTHPPPRNQRNGRPPNLRPRPNNSSRTLFQQLHQIRAQRPPSPRPSNPLTPKAPLFSPLSPLPPKHNHSQPSRHILLHHLPPPRSPHLHHQDRAPCLRHRDESPSKPSRESKRTAKRAQSFAGRSAVRDPTAGRHGRGGDVGGARERAQQCCGAGDGELGRI
jgi:hypothetical protein